MPSASLVSQKGDPRGIPGYESEYSALRKGECRRLLEALRGMGVATVDRSFARGSFSYREDEDGCAFCILTEGVIKLLISYSGSRCFTRLLGPWNIFGPLVSAREPIRWACVEAFTDCKIVKVSRASLEQAIRSHPEVALKLITLQELRLIRYQELVECLLPRRTEVRLANLFSILAREFGGRHDIGRLTIELPLTHQVLAEMVAATRESVVMTVKGLRRRKVIEVERARVTILDPEELAKIGRR